MAAATLAIYPLAHIAPYVSLSVVYLPAVLFVSAGWGLPLGLFTSLLSAAAFNFFHLPPVGQVHDLGPAQLGRARGLHDGCDRRQLDGRDRPLAHGRGGPAAGRGRPRRRALTRSAGRDGHPPGARGGCPPPRRRPGAQLCGDRTRDRRTRDERRRAIPLRDGEDRQIASLLVPRGLPADTMQRIETEVAPSLRGDRRDRAATRPDSGRGRRNGRAAPQRRCQDRASARGLPRSALAVDRDRRRRAHARLAPRSAIRTAPNSATRW